MTSERRNSFAAHKARALGLAMGRVFSRLGSGTTPRETTQESVDDAQCSAWSALEEESFAAMYDCAESFGDHVALIEHSILVGEWIRAASVLDELSRQDRRLSDTEIEQLVSLRKSVVRRQVAEEKESVAASTKRAGDVLDQFAFAAWYRSHSIFPLLEDELRRAVLDVPREFEWFLASCLSLSAEEKFAILVQLSDLEQHQVDQLMRILEGEKAQFAELTLDHVPALSGLIERHFQEWREVVRRMKRRYRLQEALGERMP